MTQCSVATDNFVCVFLKKCVGFFDKSDDKMFVSLLSTLIFFDSQTLGEFVATTGTWTGPALNVDDKNFPHRITNMNPEPFQLQHQVLDPPPGCNFSLRVQVTEMLSHQYLKQAKVDVYVNYTRTSTALTGEDGGVLLQVPFQTGLPITVVASRDGYICRVLPYRITRTPIFSSVTMPLLGLTQGNIWLFEDTFLITDKTSDASLKPIVQFPKSLLNLTDSSDVASLQAYLTIPKLPSEEGEFLNTLGIISSASGYVSMELNPVAAVSVRLFSRDAELHISGPIKISLTLPDSCGLQSSNVVPAWLYNQTTGGWMRQGLGTVVSMDGKLIWTWTAPHLGDWIAAPMPTSGDVFGTGLLNDFFVRYSTFLMVVLGAVLFIFACLLGGLLNYQRSSARDTKGKQILPLTRKDQSTTTGNSEDIAGYSGDVTPSQHGLKQLFTDMSANQHNVTFSIYNANIIANPNALATSAEPNDLVPSHTPEMIKVPAPLADNLLFYNQPVAILHASAFFQVEEQMEQPHWSKAATQPQAVALNGDSTEKMPEKNCIQNLPAVSIATQNQGGDSEEQVDKLNAQDPISPNKSRGQCGLLESASVPETLSKMRTSRHSMDAVTELSKTSSSQPPRAWFVTLEGKPAAEIHYAVAEQQRRRRAAESQETSLDSGVDMIEMNQTPSRRVVTLERNATFVKRTSSSKQTSQ
ncbi:protein FAM171B-like [Dunckerocampus dactyliophorus]|uniref:protein FAM171B-like n=1 Tax=Dunckerocampus dactyliophorus TaxID=161453 RepID=UPI002404C2EF|nr:protein FAM171B-like [Dunckerocampus dactyliophorus]